MEEDLVLDDSGRERSCFIKVSLQKESTQDCQKNFILLFELFYLWVYRLWVFGPEMKLRPVSAKPILCSAFPLSHILYNFLLFRIKKNTMTENTIFDFILILIFEVNISVFYIFIYVDMLIHRYHLFSYIVIIYFIITVYPVRFTYNLI